MMVYLIVTPVGISGETIVFSFPSPPSKTGSKPQEKKTYSKIESDESCEDAREHSESDSIGYVAGLALTAVLPNNPSTTSSKSRIKIQPCCYTLKKIDIQSYNTREIIYEKFISLTSDSVKLKFVNMLELHVHNVTGEWPNNDIFNMNGTVLDFLVRTPIDAACSLC